MPCTSYPPWLDHSNCIWQREQVVKFLVTQVFSNPQPLHPSSVKYYPQHPVLKYLQFMSLP
jgi:hypothetical protein